MACRPASGATTSTARTASRAHLRAGTVHVNQYDEDDITVPFGGYKQSGNGRDKSLHALDKYTELKTTCARSGIGKILSGPQRSKQGPAEPEGPRA